VPAPTINPNDLDPAEVAPADSYRPADPVWVYRAGGWHAGVIVAASTRAVTVTYRPAPGLGTAVDTLTAPYLFPRADIDPLLDLVAESLLSATAVAGSAMPPRPRDWAPPYPTTGP
jgi:hypothetical protein